MLFQLTSTHSTGRHCTAPNNSVHSSCPLDNGNYTESFLIFLIKISISHLSSRLSECLKQLIIYQVLHLGVMSTKKGFVILWLHADKWTRSQCTTTFWQHSSQRGKSSSSLLTTQLFYFKAILLRNCNLLALDKTPNHTV